MTRLTIGQRIDRRIIAKGEGKSWMITALKLVKARRMATAPLAHINNRLAARRITTGSDWANYVPRNLGYKTFSPDGFPELPQIVEASQAVYDQFVAQVSNNTRSEKPYFFNILSDTGLDEHPVLLDFALSPAVTEAVTDYLGHISRLNSIGVYYSPTNNTLDGSQMYHVDGAGLAQVKIFVNIWDVGPGCGGLTFIPKSRMTPALRTRGLNKQLSDDDVFQAVPEGEKIELAGPPGSGAFVDTCRCLHQGSRSRTHPRLVFSFHYVTRPDTLLPQRAALGRQLLVTRQLIEGIDLRNPNAPLFVD